MKYLAVAMLLLTGCVSSRTYNKNIYAQIELDQELVDSNIVMAKTLLKYKKRLDDLENRIVKLEFETYVGTNSIPIYSLPQFLIPSYNDIKNSITKTDLDSK